MMEQGTEYTKGYSKKWYTIHFHFNIEYLIFDSGHSLFIPSALRAFKFFMRGLDGLS